MYRKILYSFILFTCMVLLNTTSLAQAAKFDFTSYHSDNYDFGFKYPLYFIKQSESLNDGQVIMVSPDNTTTISIHATTSQFEDPIVANAYHNKIHSITNKKRNGMLDGKVGKQHFYLAWEDHNDNSMYFFKQVYAHELLYRITIHIVNETPNSVELFNEHKELVTTILDSFPYMNKK